MTTNGNTAVSAWKKCKKRPSSRQKNTSVDMRKWKKFMHCHSIGFLFSISLPWLCCPFSHDISDVRLFFYYPLTVEYSSTLLYFDFFLQFPFQFPVSLCFQLKNALLRVNSRQENGEEGHQHAK